MIDTNGDGAIDERDVPAVILATVSNPNAAANGSRLVALRGDTGEEIFSVLAPERTWSPHGHTPAVGDLDGDGRPEITISDFYLNHLFAFSHRDGSLKWTLESNVFASNGSNATLADLYCALDEDGESEDDGESEIVFGRARIIDANGVLQTPGTDYPPGPDFSAQPGGRAARR
ncbi:MAG: hypothetical protein R3F37_01680 [Candidatus Competibacteraceae bacterium]